MSDLNIRSFLKLPEEEQKKGMAEIMKKYIHLIEKLEEKEIFSQEEADNLLPDGFKMLRQKERGEW